MKCSNLNQQKNILLVSPPNPFLENPNSVPRLGLLYLGTILKRWGHKVTIVHLHSLSELEALFKESFEFVGISATTREYLDAVQILNYFKREGSLAIIAIGGSHATALPEEALRNGFDVVVTGEAEEEIIRLVNFPIGKPAIVHAGLVKDINRIPFPDRSLIKDSKLWQPFLSFEQDKDLRVASILLSRGCPYFCKFCGPHFRYRRRSDEDIVAELKSLYEQNYRGLIVLDDLPFVTERQVQSFCRQVGRVGMSFRCNFRPDLLTPRIAKLLSEAGCCRVQLGIESASQTVLHYVNKKTRVEKNGQAVEICHAHDLQVKAMFIWGLPGDGPETARLIVDWVARYRPDSIQVSKFVPLPGSPLWQEGHHRNVTDYCALSFFNNPNLGTKVGAVNNRMSQETIEKLYEEIITKCSQFSHIDIGLSTKKKEATK
ncbi:B12-binding domain-containing radical SAM protein [Patescibacteria group bacterium]|nr:B12-binding domain-containing radical SAM protein [Patescibacteria group bacterium]